MRLIKAIHMPKWSVEIFEMEKTGSYAIVGNNHVTLGHLTRMMRSYDTAANVFDLIVAGMEGN